MFIDWLCDGITHGLTNWEELYEQYFDRVKNKEQAYIQKLTKQINLLQTKYNLIQLIVRRLEIQHSDEIFNILKQYVRLRGNFTAETYLYDLQMVITQTQRLLFDIDKKKKELDNLVPKKPGDKVDRRYFTNILIQLTKHMKVHVDKKLITVGEFVAMVIDARETAEYYEKQLKKQNASSK